MPDGPQAKVTIAADDSLLRQSLREMTGKFREFGGDVGRSIDSVNSPLVALRERFIAVTAVLGGGALFGKAVFETVKLTEQSLLLGKALGVSATGARTWLAALDDAGATADDLSGASRGLVKNLRENEQGLNDMGLATRDANGHLRPMTELMLEAITLANDYADGTDRQVAVSQIFGKGVQANSALLRVNADSVRDTAEAMRDLGMVIGEEDVAAYERYDAAMDRADLTKKALIETVGRGLMPVLTKLAEWFNTIGPGAVVVVRGAIGGLASVFWGLKNAVAIAWETINAMVYTVAEPLRALGSAMYKLFTGDFKGARDELMNWPQRIGAAWSQAWDEMLKSSEEARDRMADLFFDGPEAAAAKSGTRRARPDRPPKDGKEKADPSLMPLFEAELANEKRIFAERHAGMEFTKQQELDFWNFIWETKRINAADDIALTRKTAQLKVEILRQAAQQRTQIEESDRQTAEKLALGRVDAEETAARLSVDLGYVTKAQLTVLEVQFEQERFAIQSSALQERMRLLAIDPNMNPVEMERIKNELLLLEQQHQTRRNALLGAAMQQKSSLGGALAETLGGESAWQTMLDGMLLKAQSWRQALGNIFTQAGQIFVQKLITEPAAAWLAGLARMLLVKLGFSRQEQAADVATSSKKIATKGEEMIAVVGANAAEAGAGAAASQASIPYVGPVLALAAMAAVFGAVMALSRSGGKSAAGGYDIPAGVNPMTQLHEEEMVLPSPLANAVRRMAESGVPDGGLPAARPVVFELRGVGAGDFFVANRHELARTLNGLARDFAYSPGRRSY